MTLPTLLCDQDGVLASFDRRYFDMCRENGFKLDCELEDRQHRFAHFHLEDESHRELAYQVVCEPGWFANLPPEPGALEHFHELSEHFDVWICTKPMEKNPTCRDEKARWIREHLGEEWERKLILAPDKSLVRGAILLDDAPKIEWLGRAEWQPVVYPHSFNGPGSEWEHLPHWKWGDPVQILVDIANGPVPEKPEYGGAYL